MNKKKLFIWMCVLTFLAGAVNAIAVFGYNGTTVSHVTGLITKLAINISKGNFSELWQVFLIIFSFFIGAVLAGVITGERAFYLYKRYGVIILIIGVLIILPMFLNEFLSVLLFAFIMGLQNGMVVSFKGVVVRMTHMSGNLTDLGVFIGYKIRKNKNEEPITGFIPCAALLFFTIGGIGGVLLYNLIHNYVFIIMSIIYLILGGLYFVLQRTCLDKNFNGILDILEDNNSEDNN